MLNSKYPMLAGSPDRIFEDGKKLSVPLVKTYTNCIQNCEIQEKI